MVVDTIVGDEVVEVTYDVSLADMTGEGTMVGFDRGLVVVDKVGDGIEDSTSDSVLGDTMPFSAVRDSVADGRDGADVVE